MHLDPTFIPNRITYNKYSKTNITWKSVGKNWNGSCPPLGSETGGGIFYLAGHPLDTVFQIKIESFVHFDQKILDTGVQISWTKVPNFFSTTVFK